jgi:multicomponent Na+:H+ antiporter subunit G
MVLLAIILDAVTWVFLLTGSFFSIVGGVGILRMPDLFTRMHAAGITDSAGAGLILTGLMVQAGPSLAGFKLLCILGFLLLTSPTASHALARAAMARGFGPRLDIEGETSSKP